MGSGRKILEGRLLEFCHEKELCAANTWFQQKEKKRILSGAGGYETEIGFVLVGKKLRRYVKDVKVIPWELPHRLAVVDLNEKV